MAEDTLLKTLEEDARAQASEVLKDAERRSQEIFEAARRESASLKEARLKELSATLMKERSALLNSARVRASGALLEVRRSVIDAVLKKAVESFNLLPEKEYSGLLKRLYSILEKDWESVGTGRPIVRINPSDTGKIDEKGAVLVPDPSVSLGLVFTSADGKVRKELTIPSIVRKAAKTLETEVDKVLFGGG
ncbi:MAG: hypothetical protein HY889_00580 [Deltaproteobacteria bacterium]|nr:hypothetical protein [Deltaproteobacteria bacterium]